MYDMDIYPDLSDLYRFTMPDETDTDAELARLEERDDIYNVLKSFGMLRYTQKTA